MDALPECMRNGLVSFIPSVVVYSIPWVVIFTTVPNRIGISWRESAYQLSQTSRVGVGIEIISAVCSVVSCILYVYQSYDEASNSFFGWTYVLEVSFSTSFMVYWAANLAISREPFKYIITLQSLLDLCTSLPTIITMLSGLCTDSSVTSFLAVARVLKFLRVFRLLRVVRSMELLSDAADDAIHRQTMRLISTIVVILVISTGFVQFLANELSEEWLGVAQRCHFESQDLCYSVCPRQSLAEDVCTSVNKDGIESFECIFRKFNYRGPGAQCKNLMEFHDSLYYTIVTFGTVGYGDVAPVDDVSRISMIFLIGLAIWAVPSQINALNQLRDLRSDFDRSFVKSPDRAHCIVSCDVAVDLVRFVAEFFHEDHQQSFSSTPQLILLINEMPDADLRTLLLKYASKQRLVFIRGDAANPTDLGRARVDVADAIFFLANVQAKDHDIEDMMIVRRALTARRVNPHIKVYARLLKPHNQHLLLATGVRRKDVVCHDQMRLSLLGNACVTPGIPAIVLNLGKSISWRQSMSVTSWHDEYCEGMVNEVYDLRIRADLVGITFGELGRQIKDVANGTLIAVARVNGGQVMERATFDASGRLMIRRAKGQATSKAAASDPRSAEERMLGVLCNPGMDYEIGENDVVFVIADEMKRLESFERPWHGTEISISKSPFTWLANFLVSRLCPQFLNIEAAQEFRNLQESAREQEQIRSKSQKDLATNRRVSVASVHAEDELDKMERVPSASEIPSHYYGGADHLVSATFPSDDPMISRVRSGYVATPANMTSMFQGRGRAVDSAVYGNVPGAERVKTCLDEVVDCFTNEFEQDGDKFTGHIRAFACDMIARVRPAEVDGSGDAVSRSLFEAVIHSIPDNIRGHIICVTESLSDMEFFLTAIHSPNREDIPAVIFVTTSFPTLKEWRGIHIFPKVYIIVSDDEGNPRDAFLRAGILTAKTAIVVGSENRGQSGSADSRVMANMLDVHWISMLNPDLELVSELNQGGFARKVANGLSQGRSQEGDLMNAIDSMNLMEGYQHLESSYMAGNSVKTEMLDCLVCMQYFNPYIISIMQQLLLGYSAPDKDAQSTEIVGGYGKDSVLQYHKMPQDFAGRSFGEFFEAMMREEDSIVIGLYRKVEDSEESRGQGSQSYVYTNPKSSTVLRESDHFYSIESHPIASTVAASAESPRDGAGLGGGLAPTSNRPTSINSTEREGGNDDAIMRLESNAQRLDMVSELYEDQGQDSGDNSLETGAHQASPGWDDEAVTFSPHSDDVGWRGNQRHEGGSQGKEVESNDGTPR